MPSYSRRVKVPGKSSQELYETISKDIDRFFDQATTFVGKLEVTRNPESKEVVVKAKMFSAKLVCGEESIELGAQLSIVALPFRSKIDEGIDRWLSKTFKL